MLNAPSELLEARAAHQARFCKRIASQDAVVSVVGLGYVGLPLALAFIEHGFEVLGVDTDPDKCSALNEGRTYIRHIPAERIQKAQESGRFRATTDFAELSRVDAILVAVPTPLSKQREPDLSFVARTTRDIAPWLKPGQLLVLESTTYPGTTEELMVPILRELAPDGGREVLVAYSPEREDPANPNFTMSQIPKVIGGQDTASAEAARDLYAVCCKEPVLVRDTQTAEAVKLTENIFRAVNIALVNELKVVFDRMGIDVWDVLDAAATKPFGFMKFTPGPGLGGHCIPIDPFYLTWKAREYGLSTRFIELAGEINVRMPEYVVEKLVTALNERGLPLKGSRILLLGVAYKAEVDDSRHSPAFPILHLLRESGAVVSYHDPLVPVLPKTRDWQHLGSLDAVPLTPECVAEQDAVIIITAHSAVDYNMVREHAQLIVDSRGVFRNGELNVVKA